MPLTIASDMSKVNRRIAYPTHSPSIKLLFDQSRQRVLTWRRIHRSHSIDCSTIIPTLSEVEAC